MTRSVSPAARIVGRFLFGHVAFDADVEQKLRAAHAAGTVVHVMDRKSTLDFLYFNWAFVSRGLPLAAFATGMSWFDTLLVHPFFRALAYFVGLLFGRGRRHQSDVAGLTGAVGDGQPALVFLRGARSLLQWGQGYREELLEALLEQQRRQQPPIVLLPQMLVWERSPKRHRQSLLELMFGDSEAPGRTRKLITFIRNRKRALVRFGDPIDLQAFLAEHAAEVGTDRKRMAQLLRWTVLRLFDAQQMVITGPVLKNSRQVRSEILRNEDFRAELERVASEESRSPEDVESEAGRYLREMAADFRLWAIEAFSLLLAVIWNRIYDGVDYEQEDFAKLREAGQAAPLMLVPNHRSHIDYLIISYLFYKRGLIPPHIAAGVNLSFFPMGIIFRASGAFFIRRSFRDNELYRVTFHYYLRKLLKEGYWIEFFPEGGRSRTGKLLPPKVGMIKEMVHAVADGVAKDLLFCPTGISYEKIIEEGSLQRELSGGAKQAEGMGSVLKATSVLASKYGRLSIRFGDPISTRAFVDECEARYGSIEAFLEPETFADEVKRFSYRVLYGMNAANVVTPSALVALVVLAHPRSGLSRSQLLIRLGYLADYFVSRKGGRLSTTLADAVARVDVPDAEDDGVTVLSQRAPHGSLAHGKDLVRARAIARALDDVVSSTIDMFIKGESLDVRNYGDQVAYAAVPRRRTTLDYYKNNVIHLLVHDGILATALLSARGGGAIPYGDLEARSRFLSRLFRLEFVFDPDKGFEHQFFETLGRFVEAGWVRENPDGSLEVVDEADELIVFFARSMQNFVEGYWMAMTFLGELASAPMREKDWLKALAKRADALVRNQEVLFPEALNSIVFRNALETFAYLGLVTRAPEPESGRKGRRARPDNLLSLTEPQAVALGSWIPRLDEARILAHETAEVAAAGSTDRKAV